MRTQPMNEVSIITSSAVTVTLGVGSHRRAIMRLMPHRSPEAASSLAFLQGGGEMGARMRAMDWLKTPLGPVDAWPQSLRSTVSMLLPSKAQIILFWGPEFTVLYNDAYRAVFGAKHPYALGLPGREAWSEIWD